MNSRTGELGRGMWPLVAHRPDAGRLIEATFLTLIARRKGGVL